MKETLAKFLANTDTIMVVLALTVVCVNIILTALQKVLNKIKDLTPTDADNKAAAFVTKMLTFTLKILEFTSANSTVLPPKARKEIEDAAAEKAVNKVLAIEPAEKQAE